MLKLGRCGGRLPLGVQIVCGLLTLGITKANDAGISTDDIAVLGWVDFNAPWARTKDNCSALCKGLAQLNELNPKMCGTMLIMPDLPKDSSLRGLYDEERQILEELFALAQQCECRWVEMFARENRKAETKSNTRKFGTGRIVTSSAATDDNVWLETELAMYGRSVGSNELVEGAPLAVLPKSSTILIPEPASPEFRLSWKAFASPVCVRVLTGHPIS